MAGRISGCLIVAASVIGAFAFGAVMAVAVFGSTRGQDAVSYVFLFLAVLAMYYVYILNSDVLYSRVQNWSPASRALLLFPSFLVYYFITMIIAGIFSGLIELACSTWFHNVSITSGEVLGIRLGLSVFFASIAIDRLMALVGLYPTNDKLNKSIWECMARLVRPRVLNTKITLPSDKCQA